MKFLVRPTKQNLPRLAALTVSVFSFLAFLPTLKNNFVRGWDDGINLVDNPYFRGFGWAHVKWMWTSHLLQHYVPLTWMSFALDYKLWKLNSFGYHLTNNLLHALDAGLLFWLALILFRLCQGEESARNPAGMQWGAAFAALFFSLHPLRVEAVAWASERREMLSTAFCILALLAYLRRFRSDRDRQAVDQRRFYWLSFGLFLAAILSKEMAVTLPAVLLVLDVYPLRRLGGATGWIGAGARRVWIEKIPFLVAGIADGLMTLYVSLSDHVAETLHETGWIPRITMTVYSTAFYLLKTVVPIHLSPLYPITSQKLSPTGAPFLISLTVLVAVSAAAIRLRRRFPALLAVWVIYVVTLLPVAGLFHNGAQIAADRYTYLPCLGWALLAGAAVSFGWRMMPRSLGRAVLAGSLAFILAFLAFRTALQIPVWHDTETMWERAAAEEPSWFVFVNLANEYSHDGDTLGAMQLLERALASNPRYAAAHYELGEAYLDLNRLNEALREFRTVQQLRPDFAPAYDRSGNILALEGKLDEAIADYRKAVEIRPSYANGRHNLDVALTEKERRAQQNKAMDGQLTDLSQ